MKKWQSASVIAAVTLVVVFAPCPAFTLRAQPRLTEAQAAALQPTPPSLVPRWATFWSVSRPDYPPLPFDPYPDLPVYLLPDGSYLVDDSTVRFPPPPGPPVNVAAAARSFLTQPSLASPMLNGAMLADDTDSTNAPPQDDDTDSTNSPPVLVDPGSVPAFGTFWLLVETNSPPLPTDPCTNCDVYLLSDGSYLIDDTSYVWPQPSGDDGGGGQGPPQTLYADGDFWLEIDGVTNLMADLILHGTTAGTPYTIMSRQSLTPDDPWDAEAPLIGATGQDWTPIQIPTFGRPVLFFEAVVGSVTPQRLWIYALGISNNCFNLILQGTTEDTSFDILSTTSLLSSLSNWNVETNFLGASGQFWTPVSIPLAGRQSLFLSARSWVDSTGSGIPDWWLLEYFGTINIDPYALCPSGDGWTILQAYQNGWNPTNFYTPPPPQNVSAVLDSTGTNVVITWLSGGGPVTNYVVTLIDWDPWFGPSTEQIGQVAPSTFAFTNNPGFPFLPEPAPTLSFFVSAYFTNGIHADSSQAPLWAPNLSLAMSLVRGPAAEPYLTMASPPPNLSEIRLFWTSSLTYNTVWMDVDATNLVNGLMRVPQEQMPGYAPGDQISVQTLSSDGHYGAYSPLSQTFAPEEYALAAPVPYRFVDARRHLKENLRFLLQSATITQPFSYVTAGAADPSLSWFPETEFARPPSPTNYEYSGFHVFSGNLNYSVMQEFRPVQENFLWRNLVYDDIGDWTNGVGRTLDADYLTLRWLYAPNYQFTCTNCDPLPLSLSVSNHPFFYGLSTEENTWQEFTNDVLEIGLWANGWNLYVPTGLHNVYGLALNSVLVETTQSLLLPGGPPLDYEFGGNSIDAFFSFEPPNLQTQGYYFVSQTPYFNLNGQSAASRPPLPGSPDFTTTTTSPLMIAGFGQPFTISGWAKQTIGNYYGGKFAYLEQYFTNAYTMDASGTPTTNSAGPLSPYGEFLPMQPGPAALVTMPDLDTGQQGTGVVNVIKLQLDVNHDGLMDLSFAGPDNTSQAQPFVFWLNNDCDWETTASDPGEDIENPYDPDCSHITIRSPRDLEDYARLWICGVPALTNGDCQVSLGWANVTSGNPAIRIFTSVETNGGTGYLTDPDIGAQQSGVHGTSFGQFYQLAAISSAPAWDAPASFTFPSNFFTNNANKYLLFEGWTNGTGELVLTITRNGTNVIAQTGAWLDLRDVRSLYERVEITNNTSGTVSNWTSSVDRLEYSTHADPDESQDIILYVHGASNTPGTWLLRSDTVFKRLYWAGFHGRFASVRWPSTVQASLYWFNTSELNAYKAAASLGTYLNDLRSRFPGYRLHLLAHSQGGAIVSEALSQGAPFDTLILSQVAMAASCYDLNAPTNADLLSFDAANPTPDWQPMGYHGIYTNLAGRVANYFNTNDALLNWWLWDQKYTKPSSTYSFDGTNSWCLPWISAPYMVTDSQESRAMVSRSRTLAIGNIGPSTGQTSQGVVQSAVNLNAQFLIGNTAAEHSAFFMRPIQSIWPYYLQILDSISP